MLLAIAVVEGLAIALLAVLVAGLLRSHAEILRSLHDLGAGLDLDTGSGSGKAVVHPSRVTSLRHDEQAHDIVGERLDGTAAAVSVVGTRHDTVLAFL